MHRFAELIEHCKTFTLETLEEVHEKTSEQLQTSGETISVKTLQMIRLQKAVFAIGTFSLFEAMLQEGLNCSDGFREAKNILKDEGKPTLLQEFRDMECAINVLKHGRGRSYDALVARTESLRFRVKPQEEPFFYEGDVSEITTLIEVDDVFVCACVDVVQQVSEAIRIARPKCFL